MTNDNDVEGRIAALERRLAIIEDTEAVRQLQYTYGYYVDNGLSEELATLFVEDGEIEIGRRGRYIGRDRIEEFVRRVHRDGNGPLRHGEAMVHLQTQGKIDLSGDGTTAKGRFRTLNIIASTDEDGNLVANSSAAKGHVDQGIEEDVYAFWSEGSYENEYVKVDGQWRIRRLFWIANWYAPFNDFREAWFFSAPPSTEFPPDMEPWDIDPETAPRPLIPFHWKQ